MSATWAFSGRCALVKPLDWDARVTILSPYNEESNGK